VDFKFDEDSFVLFCKNLKQLRVITMRSVAEELDAPEWGRDVASEYWDKANCCQWLIVMSAFETLRQKGIILGEDFVNQDKETQLMRQECDKITESINEMPVEERHIREILRFGTSKLHNISAYLGGVAA
jgi:predicted RNA-binding protein with PUA-like domain